MSGYGKFLGLFGHYFIFLITFTAGDAAADCFVTKLAVDCWVIRRGPLGSEEDQLPSSFLVLDQCYGRPFSLEYFPCLMVNEED